VQGVAKSKTVYICTSCDHEAPKWVGQCGDCGDWGTVVEGRSAATGRPSPGRSGPLPAPAVLLRDLTTDPTTAEPTGIEEFDRVMGGGLTPGSVTLIGGEPGVGKSTLALQVAAAVSRRASVLYASGEESTHQVRGRAQRLGIHPDQLWLASANETPDILSEIERVEPELVVIDSIQTLRDPSVDSGTGSPNQVRGCTQQLVTIAKTLDCAVVIVGHVTKDGSLAGPKLLEHLVDTVASLDGDRHHDLRLLRTTKHRFGSTNELGVFEMTREGLIGVPDTSARLLGDRRIGATGSAVAAVVEGTRAITVEVQALVGKPAAGGPPKRAARGLDSSRLAQLLAVLDKRLGFRLGDLDIYVSVVGGVKVTEPAADLAIAAAIVSSQMNRPCPADMICWGEVGLGGEVRQVARASQRIVESSRMGFRHAIIPSTVPGEDTGPNLRLAPVDDLAHALNALGLTSVAA